MIPDKIYPWNYTISFIYLSWFRSPCACSTDLFQFRVVVPRTTCLIREHFCQIRNVQNPKWNLWFHVCQCGSEILSKFTLITPKYPSIDRLISMLVFDVFLCWCRLCCRIYLYQFTLFRLFRIGKETVPKFLCQRIVYGFHNLSSPKDVFMDQKSLDWMKSWSIQVDNRTYQLNMATCEVVSQSYYHFFRIHTHLDGLSFEVHILLHFTEWKQRSDKIYVSFSFRMFELIKNVHLMV